MDNLNKNPLLDDDDEEGETVSSSKKFGNPLLEDDEESTLPELGGLSLPDLEFEYTPSGAIHIPVMTDQSEDDGSELFINDKDSLFRGVEDATALFYSPETDDSLNVASNSFREDDDSFEDDEDDAIDMSDSIESLQIALQQRMAGGSDEDVKATLSRSSFSIDREIDDEDELRGFRIDDVIARAIEVGASDIHISPDDQVAFTVLDEIIRVQEFGMVVPNVTRRLQLDIISHVLEQDFVQEMELDTSYVVRTGPAKGRRLRLSIGKSFGNIYMVLRVISDQIPTPEQLGITGALLEWTKLPKGLVMMNGSTGTGKSTTLASLLRQAQMTRRQKIITIEKPIEYVFGTVGLALVTQREVGKDSRAFYSSLTSALRQAPHIIMIGEVRNREEVDTLLSAAETGHLAISTMHTNSAPETINRIKSLYQGEDQRRVLGTLSEVTRGLANQVLVKTKDRKSQFAVRELLNVNDEVANLILEGDVQGLKAYQTKEKITMDHELVRVALQDRCTIEEARGKSDNPLRFDRILKQMS